MKDLNVWVRLGDGNEYKAFGTPFDAGLEVGHFTKDRQPRYVSKGVELDGFEGHNYISLFWGDDEAQPVTEASLNTSDRLEFEQGLTEALGPY